MKPYYKDQILEIEPRFYMLFDWMLYEPYAKVSWELELFRTKNRVDAVHDWIGETR